MPRTAAITGAYGYLGGVIREHLDAAGWSTVALVREPRPGDRAHSWSLGKPLPSGSVEGADALVHCAYDFSVRSRDSVWRVNVEGSDRLLRDAHTAGVPRLLALSSMSAYPGTNQLYGRAKLAIERSTLDLGGVAARPGLVYGNDPGGMAAALRKLARLPVVPVIGGSARQFPVHEDDLGTAILALLESRAWGPGIVGIAQPTSVDFRELLVALADGDGRRHLFLPVPGRMVYWVLRIAEAIGAPLSFRSDSVLGLMHPPRTVPVSPTFPDVHHSFREIGSSA